MTYLPTTAFQLTGFLYSSGLGFLLGLLYDFFRILFFILTGSDKKYTIVRDIIYMLVCLFATFIFMLVMCEGQVLFYALSGECIGFIIYMNTLSKILFAPLHKFLKNFRKKLKKTKYMLVDIYEKIHYYTRVERIFNKYLKKCQKPLEK